METISCITPTGDRPLAIFLQCRWMKQQSVQPTQWIIVDDGIAPSCGAGNYLIPSYAQYIRREPKADDPKHTLGANVRESLPRITGSKILIIEDDEYYAPTYIEEMSKRLNEHELVGIGRSRYYNLPHSRYFRDTNFWHASLAQTAFRSSFLEKIKHLFDDEIYIDVRIWETENNSRFNFSGKERKTDKGNGIIFDDGEDNPLYVGIKGLPGRPGMGIGHTHCQSFAYDEGRNQLKKWIPDNYESYLGFIGK